MDPSISFTETRKRIYFDKTKSREQLIQDFSQWSQDALDEITRLERRNKANGKDARVKQTLISKMTIDIGELKRLQLENDELIKERDEERRRAQILEEKLRDVMEKLRMTEEGHSEVKKEALRWKQMYEELKSKMEKELANLRMKLRENENALTLANKGLAQTRAENGQLKGKIAESGQRVAESERRAKVLGEKMGEVQNKFNNATRELTETKSRFIQITKVQNNSNEKAEQLQKDKDALLAQMEALKRLTEDLKNRLNLCARGREDDARKLGELNGLREQYARVCAELKRLQNQLMGSQSQIRELMKEKEQVLKYLREIQVNVKLVEEESSKLKMENRKLKGLTYDAIMNELRTGKMEERYSASSSYNYSQDVANGVDVAELHKAKEKLERIMTAIGSQTEIDYS